MKKRLAVVLGMVMVLSITMGCKNNVVDGEIKEIEKPTASEVPVDDNGKSFVEIDGIFTYTDLENSPFEASGLKIDYIKGEDQYMKFVKTDLKGNETVEYYNFDLINKQVEKFYYVSAMGTGFYYTFDLESRELIKIEDKEHVDRTQKTKDSGRWDSAVDSVTSEIEALEQYFEAEYGEKIEVYVAK